MHTINRALVAPLAGVVLLGGMAVGATAVASSGHHPSGHGDGTCVRQEAQVAKAEDALARVTAVFERKQQATDSAEQELADATGREKGQARKQLAHAKAAEAKAKKAKKAQQQRLTKAEQRLADCQAAQQPTDTPDGLHDGHPDGDPGGLTRLPGDIDRARRTARRASCPVASRWPAVACRPWPSLATPPSSTTAPTRARSQPSTQNCWAGR